MASIVDGNANVGVELLVGIQFDGTGDGRAVGSDDDGAVESDAGARCVGSGIRAVEFDRATLNMKRAGKEIAGGDIGTREIRSEVQELKGTGAELVEVVCPSDIDEIIDRLQSQL